MGLFNSKKNKEETPRAPANPNSFLVIRLLAVGYLLWMVKDLFELYIAGGEDAPSLWLLILTTVLFVAGSAWIAVTSWKQYKQMQAAAAQEAAEAEALLEAENEAGEAEAEAEVAESEEEQEE